MSQNPNPNDKIVHTYDDIQEEDNHLPNWWLFILFGTIVFGFGYWLVFHTTKSLPDPRTEYTTEVDALKKARLAANPMSDEAIAAVSQDPAQVEEGHKVFSATCASCHAGDDREQTANAAAARPDAASKARDRTAEPVQRRLLVDGFSHTDHRVAKPRRASLAGGSKPPEGSVPLACGRCHERRASPQACCQWRSARKPAARSSARLRIAALPASNRRIACCRWSA